MVYVEGVTLNLGDRVLLDKITFVLNLKDRIGLVGRNGAGKSTLLKILAGVIGADAGNISAPKGFHIGYLKQDLHFENNLPLLDEVKSCFVEYNELNKELEDITAQLGESTDYESDAYSKLIERVSEVSERLHMISDGNIDADVEKVMKGLGFKISDFDKKMREFSGGWQMRVELAKLLLTKPELLMLDEPTNHLDMEAIIWLENYLKSYPGIVLIISHDKKFLNNSCNKIIELELGKAYEYAGSYDYFVVEKAQQREIMVNSFQNQQKMIAQKEKTINRFMAKATKTSMAQSMQKQLNKLDRIEIPDEDTSVLDIRFPKSPHSGNIVLEVKEVDKSFGDKKVLVNTNFMLDKGDRIGFVGQNGMGKTTMAKMITGQLAATSGNFKYGAGVQISYYAQNQSELIDPKKTILEVGEDNAPPEARSKVRSILGAFLFSGDDVEKKVSVLSGGERARLAMACMIMRPGNLLILDEPTNHLDMQSKDVLKNAILQYDGTLIIVSHDREFLEGLTDKTFEFVDQNIKEYLGDINYYLSKKNFADVRQIDTQIKEKGTNASQDAVIEVDREEQKKLKRKIQYLERDIQKVEEDIKALSTKLSDPAFYMDKTYEESSRKLKKAEESLEALNSEWEILVDQVVE